MPERKTPYSRTRGFTLIELAVLITILSFVAVNVIVAREGTQKLGADIQTTKKMKKIRDALSRFRTQYGYYPCPADPTLLVTDTNFGVSLGSGTGTCTGATGLFSNAAHNVIMGMVPVRSLGLAAEDMMDVQGNRMFYAADKRYTGGSVPCGALPDIKLLSDYKTTTGNKAANVTAYQYATTPYLLMSMGADGLGAFPYYGASAPLVRNAPATPPANISNVYTYINHGITNNAATTDWDEAWGTTTLTDIFIRPRSPVASTTYYDDIITTTLDDLAVSATAFTLPTPPLTDHDFWLDGTSTGSLYQDSACTTAATTDGQSVKCWKDNGAAAHHWDAKNSEAASSVPIFHKDYLGPCRSTVHFDGGDVLSMGATGLNYRAGVDSWTVFMVIESANDGYYLSKGPDPSGGTGDFQYGLSHNGGLVVDGHGYWAVRGWVGTDVTDLNNTHLGSQFTVRYTKPAVVAEGSNVEGIDMYSDHAFANSFHAEDTAPASLSDAVLGTMRTGVGTGVDPTWSLENADIAEVLVYKRALSPAETKNTECYLDEKWNLLPPELTYTWTWYVKTLLHLDTWCPYEYTLSGSNLATWKDLAPKGYNATPGSNAALDSDVRNAPAFSSAAMGGKGGFVFTGSQSLEIPASDGTSSLLSAPLGNWNVAGFNDATDPIVNRSFIIVGSINEAANEGGYIIGKSNGATRQWEISYDPGTAAAGDGAFNIYVGGKLVTVPYNTTGPFVLWLGFELHPDADNMVVEVHINNGDVDAPDAEISLSGINPTVPNVPVTIGARPGTSYTPGSAFKGTIAGISIVGPFFDGSVALEDWDANDGNMGYMVCYLGSKWGIAVTGCSALGL